MRKITKASVAAFVAGVDFEQANMIVERLKQPHMDESSLYLHGNLIAKKNMSTGEIKIRNAGWESNVTKERLNGIPGVNINQKDFVWYLNGKEWDGDWVNPLTFNI